MTTTTEFKVKGMTCEHCVRSVTDEVARLDGVSNVVVDLGAGQVSVTSETEIAQEAVRAAVEEAGYELG